MRAPKHVFALYETCVVAISSTAGCATVVAHVIFRLHPFVLAQGFLAGQIAWKKCACVRLMPRRKQTGDRMLLFFLQNKHQYNARDGKMRGISSQAMLFT